LQRVLGAWQGEDFVTSLTGYRNTIYWQQNYSTRAFSGAPIFFSGSRRPGWVWQEPIVVEVCKFADNRMHTRMAVAIEE
jgi:hypothetical protein